MSRADVIAGLLAEHVLFGEDGDDQFECGCGLTSPREANEEDFGEWIWHRAHVAAVLAAAEPAALVASAEAIDSADCPCGHGVHLHHPTGGPCGGQTYGPPEDGFPERPPCECDRTLGDALIDSGVLAAEPAAERARAGALTEAEL